MVTGPGARPGNSPISSEGPMFEPGPSQLRRIRPFRVAMIGNSKCIEDDQNNLRKFDRASKLLPH